jgi:hypothetical protein
MQDIHTYAHTSDSRSALKCTNSVPVSLARFFFIDDDVFSLMSGTMLFMYPSYIPVMTTQTSTTCTIQYQFYVEQSVTYHQIDSHAHLD